MAAYDTHRRAVKRLNYTHPVWIRGRCLRRRGGLLRLLVLNRELREKIVHLPMARCLGQREGEFLVPAWWAHQHRLESTVYEPGTLLAEADFADLERRVLANLDRVAPMGVLHTEAYRALRSTPLHGTVTGRTLRLEPTPPDSGAFARAMRAFFDDAGEA